MPEKLPRSLDTGRSYGREILKTLDLQTKESTPANTVFQVIDPNILQADGQPGKMTLSGIMHSATDLGLLIPSGTAQR